jgi:hypothetical protein
MEKLSERAFHVFRRLHFFHDSAVKAGSPFSGFRGLLFLARLCASDRRPPVVSSRAPDPASRVNWGQHGCPRVVLVVSHSSFRASISFLLRFHFFLLAILLPFFQKGLKRQINFGNDLFTKELDHLFSSLDYVMSFGDRSR